jgi:hypothetical protein
LLTNLEREELLGGLRSLPARAPLALASAILLYLSGDMVHAWPLCWFALVPLCFACRGAGAVCALLLAAGCFFAAAVSQSFWLLDVEQASPFAIWLTAGVLPALPLAAIELPIARKIPWPLRPPILVVLAIGFWAPFPPDARMLIPCGGLIDSGLTRWLLLKLDLATLAGCMLGLGWLAAEMFATPRLAVNRRSGWTGLALAGVLALTGLVDWVSVLTAFEPKATEHVAPVVVVPQGDDLVAQSLGAEPEGLATPVFVWHAVEGDDDARAQWALKAGELARRRKAVVALVVRSGDSAWGYLFVTHAEPAAIKLWPGPRDEPLTIELPVRISLFPALESDPHWATRWSLELYVSPQAPVHPAQARWWLREQRRGAMIRGSRQVAVWQGGGAAIDGRGKVVAQSTDGSVFVARLPAGEEFGEPMGHPRAQVLERILEFSAPVVVAMLILLTPIAWAKRRIRASRQAAIAIEEVTDDTSALTKEETEKITRSYRREDL